MSDYSELVKALRCCGKYALCNDCSIFETCDGDVDKAMVIAADAIEDMSAQLADKDYLIQQQMYEIQRLMADVKRQQEKMFELAKKLPKRGERTINPYESTWAIENGYI